MFKRKTVFVLGAGASWHYGYPTGPGLIDDVARMARRLADHCRHRLNQGGAVASVPEFVARRTDGSANGAVQAWIEVRDLCEEFHGRLRTVRPLVIDYFLAWNEDLQEIGKLMIAAVILEREAAWMKDGGSQPDPDTNGRLLRERGQWDRFVLHRLLYRCKSSDALLENNVNFVTFNYDASLEFQLSEGLRPVQMLKATHIEQFLSQDRIVHAYGCVHAKIPGRADAVDLETSTNIGNRTTNWSASKLFWDRCEEAAENLRTIGSDEDKGKNADQLEMAREWVRKAEVIYILGYGFDEQNNERVGLNNLGLGRSRGAQSIMFTNFRDRNTINKAVGQTFNLGYRFATEPVYAGGGLYIEKSERDAYGALDDDFDPIEMR